MKAKSFLLVFTALTFLSSFKNLAQIAPTPKVVFIILDGIPADVLEKIAPANLDAIAAVGGYTRAYVGGEKGKYSQTPTISAVGYNSLLTGTWVNKHNVWGNSIKDPNYHYWNIFRIAEVQKPALRTAVFSTWLDNRTKLIGEGKEAAGNIKLDYAFDGFELDTVKFPHGPDSEHIFEIDEHVSKKAASYIAQNGPDLSWVYLQYTDDMGHRYGDSPQFYKAVRLADRQVGRVWKAIKEREEKYREDWMIVITTDHGRGPDTGKGHGGQSERERSAWIVTNASNLNQYFERYEPAIVDIMPTIARHLNLNISKKRLMEIDGVPLIGTVSLIHPLIHCKQGKMTIQWTALEEKGEVKIWLSTTNNFRSGNDDEYQLLGSVPIKEESITFDTGELAPSPLYKVVLEGPSNVVNKWLIVGKKQ